MPATSTALRRPARPTNLDTTDLNTTDLNTTNLDTSVPFTRKQALAAGLDDSDLRDPAYTRLFHGVYIDAGVTRSIVTLTRAALALAPTGSVAAGGTAAILWGALVPDQRVITVRVPPGERLEVRGTRALRRGAQPTTARRYGLPLTTPVQTFLDMATDLDLVEHVVLGDSLTRRGHATPEQLVAAAAEYRGPGADRARRAAAYVRSGVDSAQETRMRMLFVLARLPEPEVNIVIRDQDGEVIRRYDSGFRAARLAFEYDGRHHAPVVDPAYVPLDTVHRTQPSQWRKDLRRREESDAEGWRIVVFVNEDLTVDPAGTLERARRAMIAAGIPARIRSSEWRRYFGGRPALR